MKKIFTLCMLAVLAVAQLSAQKLKVTCEGKDYELNGDSGVINFTKAMPMGNKVMLGDMMEPIITNISSDTLTIDGKLSASKNAYKGVFQWCGFDDFCTTVTGGHAEKTGLKLEPGKSSALQVHAEVSTGAYGTYTANIQLKNNEELLGNLVLIYNYVNPADHTGINGVTIEPTHVTVTNNQLVYSFESAADRTISLFCADGKLAKRITTKAKSGELSLNGLQKGAYIYTIAQEGQTIISGKALVK